LRFLSVHSVFLYLEDMRIYLEKLGSLRPCDEARFSLEHEISPNLMARIESLKRLSRLEVLPTMRTAAAEYS